MLLRLLRLFRPLYSISRDLHRLTDLYELELASRDPPIMKRTESPDDSDTQVTYGEEADPAEKARLKYLQVTGQIPDDDYEG